MDTTVDAGTRREQRTLAGGAVAGLLGGLALAVPVVIWDWASSSHRALELPMAVTAWSFGLVHFSHIENLWWPIVIGVALLAVYWAAVGVVFAALADRLFRPAEAARTIAAGAAWSFVSFIFTWYMLLPIARGGAPFMAAPLPADPLLFTAPNWVWVLGFTLSGFAIAGSYAAFRRSPMFRREPRRAHRLGEPRRRLRTAA